MKKVWYIYKNDCNIGQADKKEQAVSKINREAGVNILTKSISYIGKEVIHYTDEHNRYRAALERIKQ